MQVFGQAPRPDLVPAAYDFAVCGPRGRGVETGDGITLRLEHGLRALESADTIVVPGYVTAVAESPPAAVLCALRAASGRGARMVSICVGAFALGHAGLLDGRRATTHWAAAELLSTQFPHVEVLPDVLYVDDGQVLTSAGFAAGLDLALHVVRRDHGAEHAAKIARWSLIAPHRDGGQVQFVPSPVPASLGVGLAATRAWALDRLREPLGLVDLAAHACCSERTLTRRFREEVGCSPKRWLLQIRVDRARELLESTVLSVDEIAGRDGISVGGRAARSVQFDAAHHSYRVQADLSGEGRLTGVNRNRNLTRFRALISFQLPSTRSCRSARRSSGPIRPVRFVATIRTCRCRWRRSWGSPG
jgi:transcriptional regulator GlxA family with amidase domain